MNIYPPPAEFFRHQIESLSYHLNYFSFFYIKAVFSVQNLDCIIKQVWKGFIEMDKQHEVDERHLFIPVEY